ncbi:MAG: hypothetical protein IPI95_13590 [Flavobacteriales bacterium]|nr:hypothetical protein [Flavobacteriales bacterium]
MNTDLYFTTANAAGLSSTFQEASNNVSIVADAGDIGLSDFTGRAGNAVHVSANGNSRVHLVPGSHLFIHPVMGRTTASTPKWRSPQQVAGWEEAEHERDTGVKVYPNPNEGKMTIELEQAERTDISQIRFVDTLGKIAFTGSMKGRVQTTT